MMRDCAAVLDELEHNRCLLNPTAAALWLLVLLDVRTSLVQNAVVFQLLSRGNVSVALELYAKPLCCMPGCSKLAAKEYMH